MSEILRRDIVPGDFWFTGEDKVLNYTLYQPGTTQDQILQDPVLRRQNISGQWRFQWELRRSRHTVTTAPPVLLKTDDTNDILIYGSDGIVLVNIYGGETAGLPEGWYWHTLWKINPDARTVVAYGKAFLRNPSHG
jgi:hypothetical protein